MLIIDENTTWQAAVAEFKAGGLVNTIELGGLGPGYEQALQLLLFAIMAEWPDGQPLPAADGGGRLPQEFLDHRDAVVRRHDKALLGLSGAQVMAATAAAWQFMAYGYGKVYLSAPEHRRITFSLHWPRLEGYDAS